MSFISRVSTRYSRSLACAVALLSLACAPAILCAETQPVQSAVSAAATPKYIFFSPLQAFFGNVAIGSTSQPISVTVTNGTTSVAHFVAFSNLNNYTINGGTCGPISPTTTLAPGASCTFSATFSPTAPGYVLGSFTLRAGNSTAVYQFKGYGVQPAFYFAPASVDFGTVPVGTNSAPVTIRVHNFTGSAATFASATPNLTDFLFQGGTCGVPNRSQSIPANTSCNFSVQFTPSTPGPLKGSFTLNTGSGPVTFTLTGVGQ